MGLAILLPLSLLLVSLSLIPALRGGPFELFPAWDGFNAAIVIFHRAFVAHPGMAYAIPGLLFWILVTATRAGSLSRPRPAGAAGP